MGSSGPLTLLVISLLCFVVAMVGVIIGCYGDAWLVQDKAMEFEQGLWRECRKLSSLPKRMCTKRSDLLEFKDNPAVLSKEKDTILVLLITSGVFCLLGFICASVMICYRRRESSWKCAAVISFFFGLIGALTSFGALGYAEYEFKDQWKFDDHGWSVLVAWISAAAQLLAAILISILTCAVPTSRRDKETVHYVGSANMTYQGDYQMR